MDSVYNASARISLALVRAGARAYAHTYAVAIAALPVEVTSSKAAPPALSGSP